MRITVLVSFVPKIGRIDHSFPVFVLPVLLVHARTSSGIPLAPRDMEDSGIVWMMMDGIIKPIHSRYMKVLLSSRSGFTAFSDNCSGNEL